jgi:hypothetical protein
LGYIFTPLSARRSISRHQHSRTSSWTHHNIPSSFPPTTIPPKSLLRISSHLCSRANSTSIHTWSKTWSSAKTRSGSDLADYVVGTMGKVCPRREHARLLHMAWMDVSEMEKEEGLSAHLLIFRFRCTLRDKVCEHLFRCIACNSSSMLFIQTSGCMRKLVTRSGVTDRPNVLY